MGNLEKDILKTVGKNIRKARRIKGIENLKEAAELSGIDKDYYGDMERGQCNFTMDKLSKVSNAFDIPIEELFINNPNSVSLKFTISDENIQTLKAIFTQFGDILNKK